MIAIVIVLTVVMLAIIYDDYTTTGNDIYSRTRYLVLKNGIPYDYIPWDGKRVGNEGKLIFRYDMVNVRDMYDMYIQPVDFVQLSTDYPLIIFDRDGLMITVGSSQLLMYRYVITYEDHDPIKLIKPGPCDINKMKRLYKLSLINS